MTGFFWIFLVVFHFGPQRPVPAPQPPRFTCCAPPKRHILPKVSR